MGILANLLVRLCPDTDLSHTIFPPTSTYDPERDVPDLTGKVVIVTGANVGIGYETAKQLVLKNAKVYIACRDETKAREAIHKLEAFVTERHTKGQLEFLKLDLSDLDAVKQAADDFLAKEKQLDLLFCNAGVMKCPPDLLTKQNYDLQWGASRLVARSACSAESVSRQERTSSVTTYFASSSSVSRPPLIPPILSTDVSRPQLPALETSFTTTGTKPRIMHTSSSAHKMAPGATGIEWSTLEGGEARDRTLEKWGGFAASWRLYGQSKLGNILASNILSSRYPYLVSTSLHPGGIATDLQRHLRGLEARVTSWLVWPVEMGAWTQLWGATSDEGEGFGGKYLWPWARLGRPDKRVLDPETQRKVEEYLDAQIKPWVTK
ncbi:putative oxidoreductase [Rhodotorula toruloides]|nr:putative oxidoreductase [Rhodotorula toruloides]